jgi:hypothetical protein
VFWSLKELKTSSSLFLPEHFLLSLFLVLSSPPSLCHLSLWRWKIRKDDLCKKERKRRKSFYPVFWTQEGLWFSELKFKGSNPNLGNIEDDDRKS